jgi:hypothetical protein
MNNNSPSNNGMWSSKRNLFVNDCESSSAWSHKNLKCHKPNKCETRFTNKAPVYHNQNLVKKTNLKCAQRIWKMEPLNKIKLLWKLMLSKYNPGALETIYRNMDSDAYHHHQQWHFPDHQHDDSHPQGHHVPCLQD